MEIKTTITAIIAAVVCMIIIVAVAIPVISNVSTEIGTAAENTRQQYNATSSPTDTTITLEDSSILINGEAIETGSGILRIVIITDDLIGYWQNYSSIKLIDMANNITTSTRSISIVDGSVSYIDTTTTESVIVGKSDYYIIPSNNGNYGAFRSNVTFNVDVNSTIYVAEVGGLTDGTNQLNIASIFKGTVENMTAVKQIDTTDYTEYTGDMEFNWGTTPERVDNAHYSVNSAYSISTTLNGVEYSATDITNAVVFAPIKYHYVAESDNTILSIVNIVPLLMIVGLIIAIVGTFIRTR